MHRLRPAWLRLERGAATMFQSFAWNRLAAEVLGTERPHVIVAETSNGAAIVPAAIGDRYVTFLGEALFDYRDVLFEDEEALSLALHELAGLQLPLWLTAIRAGDHPELWRALPHRRFAAAPCTLRRHLDADTFARSHSLGRQIRRLQRLGCTVHRRNGADSSLVRFLFENKAQQMDGAADNLFADPRRIDFMVEAARLPESRCEIFTVERGTELVSALLTFIDGKVRRLYNIWYDRNWAHFSPGMAVCYESIRQSLEEGLDCDLMTGEQPHKLRLATSAVDLYQIEAPPSAIAQLARDLTRSRVAA